MTVLVAGLPAGLVAGPAVACRDHAEALAEAARVRPAVALVAADLAPEGGVSLAAELVRGGTPVVLACSGGTPPLHAALRAGVRVVIDARADDLERALVAARRGDLRLGRGVAGLLPALAARPSPVFPELSAREREVIAALARDRDVHRAARRLGLAVKTVRQHVGPILAKTGASDAEAAGRLARMAGLVA